MTLESFGSSVFISRTCRFIDSFGFRVQVSRIVFGA